MIKTANDRILLRLAGKYSVNELYSTKETTFFNSNFLCFHSGNCMNCLNYQKRPREDPVTARKTKINSLQHRDET